MTPNPYRTRKLVLLGLMIGSVLPFFLLFDVSRFFVPNLLGLIGGVLIFWQFLLGNRLMVGKWIPDLIWVNWLHKQLGIYGFLLILLHPLLLAQQRGWELLYAPPDLASSYDIAVANGRLGLMLLFVIWISSALLRGKLPFRFWRYFHYLTYPIFPLVYLHAVQIGTMLLITPALMIYWQGLGIFFALTLLYRIGTLFGLGQQRYQVVAVEQVTGDVYRYRLVPLGRGITPASGQFAYLQPRLFAEAHPFTVSHFDAGNREISFSIKQVGKFTQPLPWLVKPGDTVRVDGPYGVFTREAQTTGRPIVLIAGGIGITPFLRLMRACGQTHLVTLFYGNRTADDIAYREDVEKALDGVTSESKVVHVLSMPREEEKKQFETGYVSLDLLKKYLSQPLEEYEFLICGPPTMMVAVAKTLEGAGVPTSQIDTERFSL